MSGVGSPASASGRRSCVFCGARAWRRSAASWATAAPRCEAALKARPADEEENARLKKTHDGGRGPAGEDRPPGGRPPFSQDGGDESGPLHLHGQSLRPLRPLGLGASIYAQRRREAVPVHERPTPNKRGPVGPCILRNSSATSGRSWRTLPVHGEGYSARCGRGCASGHPHQQGADASPDAGGGASPEVPRPTTGPSHRAAREA